MIGMIAYKVKIFLWNVLNDLWRWYRPERFHFQLGPTLKVLIEELRRYLTCENLRKEGGHSVPDLPLNGLPIA